MTIYHNSHDPTYRIPFGAVDIETSITIRVDIDRDDVERVQLCYKCDYETERTVEMNLCGTDKNKQRFETSIMTPKRPQLIWYYFLIEHETGIVYYGNNDEGYGGIGKDSSSIPRAYQITVYEKNLMPPKWFQGKSIMYQIFVDRFYNGNEDGAISHPKQGSLLQSHWNNDPVYVRGEHDEILAWDFFGGNLLGVKKKLHYLANLGVDVIYLNPIFQSPSNHKYDTSDYHKIDEMFGDEEIFQVLCKEAKELGISIILDGVFSHTGSDSKYFNREGNFDTIGAYQSTDSPYFSWYRFMNHPNEYEAWWGIGTMPNVNELDPSFLKFLIHDENSVINHWHKCGIAGWRLDVADELPGEFMKQLKKHLRKVNPDAVLIGEVWEDASNKISYQERREYLLGSELDSVTNYIFKDTTIAFIQGHMSAEDVHKKLMSLYENYPREHFYSLMNIIGTHDTPRVLSEMSKHIDEKCDEIIHKRMKLITLWQLLFPGVPCIYYGDEAGVAGEEEPLNRRSYPWGNENQEYIQWYRKIISIRKQHDVFSQGEWSSFASGNNVYGFMMEYEESTVIVLLNRNDQEEHVTLPRSDGFVDLISNETYEDQTVCLQPLQGAVLFCESR